MSAEDAPPAVAVEDGVGVVDADDRGAANGDGGSHELHHAPSGGDSSGGEAPSAPRPRVHPERSVPYVTVSDPVQHTEGLKGKFTMYRVAYDPPPPSADADAPDGGASGRPLFPYATSANRRYSDFSWLFDRLHRERPGAIVPPLPEKQQASRFSEAFIEDRRFHLEVFLRRVVRNPELKDAECLLVFLGGGDAEFKKAKKDKSVGGGKHAADAGGLNQTLSDDCHHDGAEAGDDHQDHGLTDRGKRRLSTGKAGIKKWIKEKKTTMQGSMVRSPDDAVFDEATHFVEALQAGLRRVEAQASAMVRRDKGAAASLLEFGLGCDALAHVEDEINGNGVEDEDGSSGMGKAFRMVGKTADAASAISAEHYERELGSFAEPLRDHLKMVHAAKVALTKRNNRRITYSTCLNAVDSKKATLHKHRITPGQEGKALGVEGSLSRAEQSVLAARANYEECSARVLREIDRFRTENATAMYATMAEFARAQKAYHERMNDVWGELLPQIEGVDPAVFNGKSFTREAATMREGSVKSVGTSLSASLAGSAGVAMEAVAEQMEGMSMPSYPPPPEPTANGGHGAGDAPDSSVLNGAVRYRAPLPEE
ncbi:hypothetical protein ACHAWF_016959 [Thalassiosira exigua]